MAGVTDVVRRGGEADAKRLRDEKKKIEADVAPGTAEREVANVSEEFAPKRGGKNSIQFEKTGFEAGGKRKVNLDEPLPPGGRRAVVDEATLARIKEKFAKGTVGAGGVMNPRTINETTWMPLQDFLKKVGFRGEVSVFHDGKPSDKATLQGDIGNCFFDASDAGLANNDPNFQKQRVREVGIGPDGKTKLYAVLDFVPTDSDVAKLANAPLKAGEFRQIQRAGPDVAHTLTLPDPKDPKLEKTVTVTKTSTPVWVVVSDEVPLERDGKTLNSSDVRTQNEGAVLYHFLTEKAQAVLNFGTYRNMNNGGDAAKAMEGLTGYPAVTFDIARSEKGPEDEQLAINQFKAIYDHHRNGGTFVIGTWGNGPDRRNLSLIDADSIARVIRQYPQYSADGRLLPQGQGFFKLGKKGTAEWFRDGTGTADHASAKESKFADQFGSNSVGDHDQTGKKAELKGNISIAVAKLKDMILSFRNPWGSTRPIQFKDSKARDDGVSEGPWAILRTLIGTVSLGGRPKADHDQWLQNVTAPALPKGAKSTFKLVGGETAAK